ncbi:hypothetical protein [Phocaeicola oris]|uniref:hypothetical protein n=1 Tax=Phocaeicola oris TaxID=2896850 RepID=UPI00234E6ED8|nr:hypothetical protein [Phocaeicola oris]MCE2616636.1 hypothetical protein [Phocaeicola oris]
MRKILFILFVFLCSSTMAQQKRIYFFPEFIKSKIVYKNKAKFVVMLNYDASNKKMLYMQDDQMMELINPQTVDTIYTGGRTWVYHNQQFCEVIQRENGNKILIGWVMKNVYKGQKGALGMTTQAHVQKLRAVDFAGAQNGQNMNAGMEAAQYDSWNADFDVWKQKNNNTYYFNIGDKQYALTSLKSVYKAFPERKEEIKMFVHDKKLDMMNAEKALEIIDFLMRKNS